MAEDALARELERRRSASLLAEIKQDVAAAESYAAANGSFADLMREHYSKTDDDPV